MIEKMKRVVLAAAAPHKEEMLTELRELGILHLASRNAPDPELTDRLQEINRLSAALQDYAPEVPAADASGTPVDFKALCAEVQGALSRKTELETDQSSIRMQADALQSWGDFEPSELLAFREKGLSFRFFRVDKHELAALRKLEEIRFVKLGQVDRRTVVAVLDETDAELPGQEFVPPALGLRELREANEACQTEIDACVETLRKCAAHLDDFRQQLLEAEGEADFSAVRNTAEEEDGVVWLTGYVPESEEQAFVSAAQAQNWAWMVGDVDPDDPDVPTRIRYNKVTALTKPVFEILGTVPGYHEYDISFWFLAFFALFVAMIIGDAGYGVILLLGTIGISAKQKKMTNALMLLLVLSGATIIWGALTGTWFGAEGAMKIPFLKALVIPAIANYPEYFGLSATDAQNNVMKFCFSIGEIQLALACIMSIRRKFTGKDLSWIADFGWLCSISALYLLVLNLVVGQSVNLGAVAGVVIFGFLLVVVFGGMAPGLSFGKGLKAGLGSAFTVFLNTISAFGNVMSYIRLFAVGMASLAIAQSFNDMASGFSGVLTVVAVVILLIGHVLNLVMGALSVVVHGVRLNLLEFSGQLGMEWSGIAYNPFRKLTNTKK